MNKHITIPKFSRLLSFDEQKQLPQEHIDAYCDFVLSRPLKTKVSESELLDRDYQMADANYTKAEIGG